MKYSMKSLDFAIDKLLPKIKIAKDGGVSFNRPTLLKMVAEKYFLEQFNQDHRDYNESMCYFVCKEALVNLWEDGQFTFGERDLEVELGVTL